MLVPRGDDSYMEMALAQARLAFDADEVPIGAIIVHDDQVIAKAYNQQDTLQDPPAHAEIIAITQAASKLGNWRLQDCTLYVTKEPCPMCAGALVNARVKRVVYGVRDERCGGFHAFGIHDHGGLLHSYETKPAELEWECLEILQDFFKKRRKEQKELKKQRRAEENGQG